MVGTRYSVVLVIVVMGCLTARGAEPKLELVQPVKKIWDAAPHNAFTDLIRFQDKWFCTFREGTGHAKGAGKIRVLTSTDGDRWTSAALIEKEGADLRDPKLSIMPDGRLLLNGGAAEPPSRDPVKAHYSFVCWTKDGQTWSSPERVLADWNWLWRITWRDGVGYGVAYAWDLTKPNDKHYRAAIFATRDALQYTKLADVEPTEGTEATIRFQEDTALCLLRRDHRKNMTSRLGVSRPPYTEWEWKDLGQYVGGQNALLDPAGNWWVAARNQPPDGKFTTKLWHLDPAQAKLTEAIQLPSGGDSSYPGLVWHEEQLWVSYYSSHEGKAAIYLARLKRAPAAAKP